MEKQLVFTEEDGMWVTRFTSEGACVVQMERRSNAPVSVKANIGGMRPVPVASFANPYVPDAIFKLNVAVGLEVTIQTTAEVTNAKMLTND